jgi:hypothetical protein
LRLQNAKLDAQEIKSKLEPLVNALLATTSIPTRTCVEIATLLILNVANAFLILPTIKETALSAWQDLNSCRPTSLSVIPVMMDYLDWVRPVKMGTLSLEMGAAIYVSLNLGLIVLWEFLQLALQSVETTLRSLE